MHFGLIFRVVGIFLMLFSIVMLPPAFTGLYFNDGDIATFFYSFLWTFVSGLALWLWFRKQDYVLRTRDGFVVVVLFWTVLGLFGAIPFMLSEALAISFTDAVFESLSGLTTTGATVITKLDGLPHSVLLYRHLLQWLGGMGIIVLAVAVLPMLGVGGMQLYRAETPGPVKDSKLTPRIAETAKALWYIYLGLTIICAVAYDLAGMSTFDAICHSFSTIAIGGFSTHDASMGYFSPLIQSIAIVFMLFAGINFALHFFAWRSRSLRVYMFDSEVRAYLMVLLVASIITTLYLYFYDSGLNRISLVIQEGLSHVVPISSITGYPSIIILQLLSFPEYEFSTFSVAFHHGVFQAVSIGTTTGYSTSTYWNWPGFLPVMLLFISFIGGCAGSTGGGMKVIRFLILVKQGMREILRLIHPNASIPIKVGEKAMPNRVLEAVWGFFAAYVAAFSIILLLLMFTGLDQTTAFSAVAACMNNLGPGLGDVGAHYANINSAAKWILGFAMLLGRLEVFTLLVILSPAFWRR